MAPSGCGHLALARVSRERRAAVALLSGVRPGLARVDSAHATDLRGVVFTEYRQRLAVETRLASFPARLRFRAVLLRHHLPLARQVDAGLAEVAAGLGLTLEALTDAIARARALLHAEREKRVHPGLDDKVLASWNGLMLAAFAEAAAVLGRDDYFARGHDLRAEWEYFGLRVTDHEWYRSQLDFLRGHRYFTASAYQLREATKQANMAHLLKLRRLAERCRNERGLRAGQGLRGDVLGHRRVRDQAAGHGEPFEQVAGSEAVVDLVQIRTVDRVRSPSGRLVRADGVALHAGPAGDDLPAVLLVVPMLAEALADRCIKYRASLFRRDRFDFRWRSGLKIVRHSH